MKGLRAKYQNIFDTRGIFQSTVNIFILNLMLIFQREELLNSDAYLPQTT